MQECIGVLFSSPKGYILYTITILMDHRWIKRKAPTMSSLFDSRQRQKKGDFYIRPFTTKTFQARMGMQERGRGCTLRWTRSERPFVAVLSTQ